MAWATHGKYEIDVGRVVKTSLRHNVVYLRPSVYSASYPVEYPAVLTGNAKNNISTVSALLPGTVVLYIKPSSVISNDLTGNLCFILDVISMGPDDGAEQPFGTAPDSNNPETLDIWQTLLDFQGVPGTLPELSGDAPTGAKPGEKVQGGIETSHIIGQDSIRTLAGISHTEHSAVDNRISEVSVLRTTMTVGTFEDTAIIGEDTLMISQVASNIYDGFYKSFEPSPSGVYSVSPDWQPVYRMQTLKGGSVYGTHFTVLSEDLKTPLFTSYTGMDGSLQIRSANRVSVRKTPDMLTTEYIGNRLMPEAEPGEYDPNDPLKALSSNAEAWKMLEGTKTAETTQVKPEDPYNSIGDPLEVEDTRTGGLKVYPTSAGWDITPDGSIIIRDGYGSYILMSRGNIELHAANNMFVVSGRDTLMFQGGVLVSKSRKGVQLASDDGDITVTSQNKLQLYSKAGTRMDSEGYFQVVSKQDLLLSGANTTVQTDTSGLLTLSAPSGQLMVEGATVSAVADNSIYLTTSQGGGVLLNNNSCVITAELTLTGSLGITSKVSSTYDNFSTASVSNPERKVKLYKGNASGIKVSEGSIAAGGSVSGKQGVYALSGDVMAISGAVCGKRNTQSFGGKYYVWKPGASAGSFASKISGSLTFSAPSLKSAPTGAVDMVAASSSQEALKKSVVRYNLNSKACQYMNLTGPVGNGRYPYKPFIDIYGDTSYIYPGEDFWKTSGLGQIVSDDMVNITEVSGFDSMEYNIDNVTEQ